MNVPPVLMARIPDNARVLTLAEARELAAAGSRWVMVRGRVAEQKAAPFAPVLGTPWVRVGCDADELLVTAQDAELLVQEQGKTKRKRQ